MIRIFEHDISQSKINIELMRNEIEISKMEMKQHSLEEYFLNLINKGEQYA
ncbi:hypothetical protein [Metabacillus niabensis]|uniref:hypothetical protein n=1 Tax=Metabacillus niabensis TaxID=324854 RepID=UPI0039A172F4